MAKWFEKKRYRGILIFLIVGLVLIYTLQPALGAVNILINGTFQIDDSSWTKTLPDAKSTATWVASGPANGGYFRLRASDASRTTHTVYAEQTFNVTKTPSAAVPVSFYWGKAFTNDNGNRTPLTQTATIRIYNTANTQIWTWTDTNLGARAWTQVTNQTIAASNFATAGTYKIRLEATLRGDSGSTDAGTTTDVLFDEITVGIDQNPPSSVTSLTATAISESQVNLSWGAVTDDSGGTVKYDVYKDGTLIAAASDLTTTSYSVTGLTAGTNYTFEVKAKDPSNNVSTGNTQVVRKTLDTTAPSAVTVSATAASSTQINLSWNSATDNVGVAGYDIYRGGTLLTSVGSGVTTYSDTGLTASTSYTYEVKAKDAAGNVSTGNITASATTQAPPDSVPPNAVTNLTGTAVSGIRIDLQWSPTTDNTGGMGMKDYLIFKNGIQIGTVNHDGSNSYTYQVTGLTPSTAYIFEVKPRDNGNNVQTSGNAVLNKSTLASDTTPPSAVLNLAATTQSYSSIRLTWSASTDNRGVSTYDIYRITPGPETKIASISDNGNPTYSYDVTGLSASSSYTYEVRAVDLDGNISTGNNQASATTYAPPDTTPPNSVTGLTATPTGGKRVDLEWSKSTDNIAVDHYDIYQNGSYAASVTDGGATTLRYSITGLTANTTYNYEIKAVDGAGNVSSANWTASATTLNSTDNTAPTAVTSTLTQVMSSTKVKLTWNASTDNIGVSEYQINKDGTFFAVVKDNGASTFKYYAQNLAANTTYNFEVIAIDKEGNISTGNIVKPATTSVVDLTAPTTPTSLNIIKTTNNTVDLGWNASTDAVGVVKYKIYRNENGSGFKSVGNSFVASFSSLGLKANTTYQYKVSALDAANNESAVSNIVSITTLADTTAPFIVLRDPGSDENDIGQATKIKVIFDDGLNPATVNSTNFYLKDSGNSTVAATVSYDDIQNAMVLTPTSNLTANMTYTATVTTGVKNSSGMAYQKNYSWSFVVGTSTFTVPHGNYTNDTKKCGFCHVLHTGKAPGILKQSTQTSMCFTCHDGTGSNYNVASMFASDSGNITAHPVKDTELVNGELIKCTDCHNPHGNAKAGGGFYARLLRSFDGTAYNFQGVNFCLSCHGSADRQWSMTYYKNTLGDHSNPNAAHYTSGLAALTPPSGSGVNCVMCHDKHASSNNRLIREDQGTEDTLCSRCHSNTANSISGRNIIAEFNRTGSRHGIFDSDQVDGTKVECRSCHGPHTVGRSTYANSATLSLLYSDLSDPDNTYKFFTFLPGVRNTSGRFSEFCLKCHDGSPPVKSMYFNSLLDTVQIPFSIRFPSNPAVNFTSNNSGWNKSPFLTAGHFTYNNNGNRVECNNCHEVHGSDYKRLLARPEDTGANGICFECHAADGASKSLYPGAPDIKTEMSKTYNHPTLTNTGKHNDTENYNNMALTDRHAECVDCHDPHSAQADTTTAAPNRSNILKNVSGVAIGSRTAWTSLLPTSNLYTFKTDIAYQYELCYKCHSSYSTTAGTAPTRDVSKEFNPANKGYHPIEATGQTSYGTFVNGLSTTSRVVCTNCHGSDNASAPKGPHGSSIPKILKKNYDVNTGTGYTNDLCFNCHDSQTYAADAGRSGTGYYGDKGNLHSYHINKYGSIKCQWCHSAVVHGWNGNKHLIVTTSDSAPYKSSIARLPQYVDPGSRNYNSNNSLTTCGHPSCDGGKHHT